MTGRRIVADVGGTRSRFGISRGPGDLSEIRVYPTAGQSSFAEALATYVIDIGAGPAEGWCGGAYIAAAGPVDRGAVQLTNAAWSISARAVSQHLGGVSLARPPAPPPPGAGRFSRERAPPPRRARVRSRADGTIATRRRTVSSA